MDERYAVHLKISRVTTTEATARTRDTSPRDNGSRRIETVDLTVRAPSLEKLIEKIDAHLALIDGDDFAEDSGIHR